MSEVGGRVEGDVVGGLELWYGMPTYAKDGNVVCYFQSAEKFDSRYATLGFNDTANLGEGGMWQTSVESPVVEPGTHSTAQS